MFRIRESQIDSLRPTVESLPRRLVESLQRQGLTVEQVDSETITLTDEQGKKTTQLFTPEGLPATTILPSGARTTYTGDRANPFSSITLPTGERFKLELSNGKVLRSLAIAGGGAYTFDYGPDGRLARVTYPDSSQASFEGQRELERYVDRCGAATQFKSEQDGRQQITDPLGRTVVLEPNERSALQAIQFADGKRQTYEYDDHGRPTHIERRDGSIVSYSRPDPDAVELLWPDGKRTKIARLGTACRFEAEGRYICMTTSEDSGTVSEDSTSDRFDFIFNRAGRIVEVRSRSNGPTKYEYNDDGHLVSLTDCNGNTSRFDVDPIGFITGIDYAAGPREVREKLRLGLLDSSTLYAATGQPVARHSYAYDSCDRVVEFHDASAGGRVVARRYRHDAEGRLIVEADQLSGEALIREYDQKGNIKSRFGVAIHVGVLDEVLSYGKQSIEYDDLGNVVRLPRPDGRVVECQWHGDGSLARVHGDDVDVSFSYDPLGRRIEKRSGVSTWRYGWAGNLLMWEEHVPSSGAEPRRRNYQYLPDGTPFSFTEAGQTFWLQTDNRGAVIRVFDSGGTILWRGVYDAFGQVSVELGLVRQPLRLAGQYEDAETGLYYNFARYYSPWLEAYLSLDPSWLCGGASNYSYCQNNPLNCNDRNGALGVLAAIAIAGLVGAAINVAFAYFFSHGSLLGAAINGFITGALTAVGAIFGGPWGAIAGGAIGTFLGTFVEGAISGQGWEWGGAASAAATSVVLDLALLGLGKIPPVKKVFDRLAEKADDSVRKLFADAPPPTPKEIGDAGEEAVSKIIGLPRNNQPGRNTIPGTGPGGERIPDFDPDLTIPQRGTVVEVKNVQKISMSPQLHDMVDYAQKKGVPLEIFTNAEVPSRGELKDLYDQGKVIFTKIQF